MKTEVEHPRTPGLASDDDYDCDEHLTAKIEVIVAGMLFGLIVIGAIITLILIT